MSRFFSLLIVLGVLLGSGLAIQTWYLKPYSIDLFYTRFFLRTTLMDPEQLTRLRVLEPLGLEFHNDDLTDASPAHTAEQAQLMRDSLSVLESYDRKSLAENQQLSYDVLLWYLRNQVAGERFMYHDYPVNQLFGVQSELPSFMLSAHRITHPEDARNYILRLSKFPEKFDQLIKSLQLREQNRILPPRFVVDRVLKEMRDFIQVAPDSHVLYTNLGEKLGALQDLPDGLSTALMDDAKQEIENAVYPAYRKLIQYFEGVRFKASGNHGAWALPNGDDYYNWTIAQHTTTELDADVIHEMGLSEVKRIEREMDALLDAEGYKTGTVGERMRALGLEPRFQYPDTDAGRQQIINDFQVMIDEMDAGIAPYFGVRPEVGVTVRRVPVFREATAPGAYYEQPPLDGSQPGVFYINLRNIEEIQRFSMRTLAYHEAVPGHHFQIAIQQELQDLPLFRKVLPFTAYVEGWALYAERLAKEIGFQDDPYNDLGRLQDELFRAVRLVVDTGLHRKRWSREEAIAYMRAITGRPESDIVAEVERYLVLPGQALAYKIGMIKMLELRDRAQRKLGNKFDLREFHDRVLTSGAVPLVVLEQQVDRYIDEARRR